MSPVFDEAKYRALLEKLEIFENPLKCVQQSSSIFRLDSSFFDQKLINLEQKVKSMSHFFIESSNVVSGPFGSMLKSDAYQATGIPFIRIENIKDGFYINNSDIIYISPEDNERIKNSELSKGDIVLSKVGNTIGFFAEVSEDIGICNISENNIGIKLTGFTDSKKAIVLTYLNTHIAQSLTLRRISGNAQPKLNVGDVCEIPIPVFNTEFEKGIEFFLQKSKKNRKDAINSYLVAEHLLLQELGLPDWQPDDESVATKTFADFQNSGRLDAEYYQPKYDDLFKRISSYDKSHLGDIVNITKSIEPGSEAYQEDGVPFLRVSDITKFGIAPPEIHLDRDKYYSENLTPKKDTILLSKDGSVGIAYKVENDLDVITSGALLHLTVKNNDFLPDYLTLVLNSIVVKLQAERDAGGSIIQHWKPSEIENVIIPKLPKAVQNQIAEKVRESFALRKESKRLLDLAKHAVEVAIEQGEDVAMKLLEN